MLYAHSREGVPEGEWEPLEDHLRAVSRLAAHFAEAFGAEEWGRVAGLLHDLGKARPEFQARIRGERVQTEHAGVGAALAATQAPSDGLPIAFAVAGHHSGMPNWRARGDTGIPTLTERVDRNRDLATRLVREVPILNAVTVPPLPTWLDAIVRADLPPDEKRERVCHALDLLARMLFSALVDADRLATEAFCDPGRRPTHVWPALDVLDGRLDSYLSKLRVTVDPGLLVNQVRDEVLQACRVRSQDPAGVFTLTVPTGGGKTLSSMSFALKHALRNNLRRVIVVLPYTSIIEQNARVFRAALGDESVVEHHSNVDEEAAAEQYGEFEDVRQCATENWDAPVIVTTTVQFLESLFSNRPGRCRKLHSIARGVVILDEVQTLPPAYLSPILDILNALRDVCGCTLVLATATPPALRAEPLRPFGLRDPVEVVPRPNVLASRLRRVKVRWPASREEVMPHERLARELETHPQVLAIVHLRQDARQLAAMLPPEGRFHLSALMCPAHRLQVLARVHQALQARSPCRVVSTQLIEAGVDIDFPVVYRALAGLDSLTQAAGRCNREGKRCDAGGHPTPGDFVVFRAETKPPPGVLRMALESTETMLAVHGAELDLQDPGRCGEFFQSLYFKAHPDAGGIQELRGRLAFADVGAGFRIIDDYARALVVPYEEADRRLHDYRQTPSRSTRRALQPYTVNITPRQFAGLKQAGAIDEIDESVRAIADPYRSLYDEEFGLMVELDDLHPDPAAFVV